ncbi:E3 ubiquitin-protein ligase AIRP2-like isoform X1 [Amaranthus tricolor]|uniref:E3 ubiquitin-protein ligase AIRP2-like isoform X1 n=1 Tax=Amaranthus tricolor TaxID=29722 RepID=UPI0025905AC9|nr:E3 ubiquitin-protein ligase AIRP2-like isoform X1 [Amaranthus tricolor]
MLSYQLIKSSTCQESLKAIEADIQHANMLAASIPRNKSGNCLQMKLVHNDLAPLILYLLHWINCSCTCLLPSCLNLFYVVIYKVNGDGRPDMSSFGRRATLKEFYAIILPYLQRLHGNMSELDDCANLSDSSELAVRKIAHESRKDIDIEREDECGICLEPCTKMVLPNCCHSMCINCYRDWNLRSESCPFCRGSIKRVQSGDLWVLTCGTDVVDRTTVMKEDILRLYLYINSLPKDVPDALFLMYYEYLI